MTVRDLDSKWQCVVDWLTAGRLPRCPDFMSHFGQYEGSELHARIRWLSKDRVQKESWRDTFCLGKEWRAEGYNWFGGGHGRHLFGGTKRGYHYRTVLWRARRG